MIKRISIVILLMAVMCCAPCGSMFGIIDLNISDAYAATEDFETGDFSAFLWSSGAKNAETNEPVNASWSVVSGSVNPGKFSAKSPAILDSQLSYLETTMNIAVAGDITFWYRVSSELDGDYLIFYIDGIEQGRWSGDSLGWQQSPLYPVTTVGDHIFRWEYSKDFIGSDGSDAAWIDDVVFPASPANYTISASVDGVNGTISCTPSVVIQGSGTVCSITPDKNYRLTTLIDNMADVWAPFLGNSYTIGKVNSDHNIVATFGPVEASDIETFETRNLKKFPWITGGDAKWGVTASGHTGAYAAKAPTLLNLQASYLETTLSLPADDNVSFWYLVSSEAGADFLKFYIDGVEKGAWSGIDVIEWTQVSFPVSAGSHTFRWEYSKDSSDVDSVGSDTAWIDDIIFPGAVYKSTYNISSPGAIPNGSISCSPSVPAHGMDSVCTILADSGYHLGTLTDNTLDKRSSLVGNKYTISKVSSDHIIAGTFEQNEAGDIETFETGNFSKFPWKTGGSANKQWSVTKTGHNGIYAAEAPDTLDNNETSYLETSLFIPASGNVTFWYRVFSEASEAGGDFLRFYIDGIEQGTGWSGELAWAQATYHVTPGDHIFRWEYIKDGSVSTTPFDTAWIDDIVFPGAIVKPSYTISTPAPDYSGTIFCTSPVLNGENSVCTITPAVGYHLVTFTDNLIDKMSSILGNSYTINNVISDHAIAGKFISNIDVEDFETGDLTKFPWSTGGNAVWSVTNSGHTGLYAAQVPSIAHDTASYLKTTLTIPADSSITFWYRVSSEPACDFLRFYIDDVEQGPGWAGEVDWAQGSFPVTAGNHVFKWEYSKDIAGSAGSDTAWIDDIVFTGATPAVKVLRGTASIYKWTLYDAYNSALSDDVIMLKSGMPREDLTFDKDMSVSVKGGYGDDFGANNSSTATGTLRFKAGKVRVENLTVK